ncbi:hypothetical protein [Mycobacterium sp.]|uniref:hypothetical protein n=1 Tax=Mycobacterium sp. TaxID=1785 RepID=UPI0031D88FCB
MRSRPAVIVATACAFAGWALACAGSVNADPPPPPPTPATTIDHDGTFAVGTDVVPGTYSSPGPAEHRTCYWKRVGGASGNEVVDNALTKKPQVVRIEDSDKAFKTDGCQPWQLTDPANADVPNPADMPALGAQARVGLDLIAGIAGQHQPPPQP